MFLVIKNARRLTAMSAALADAAHKTGTLRVDHRGAVVGRGVVGATLAKAMGKGGQGGTVPFGDTVNFSDGMQGERGWSNMIRG